MSREELEYMKELDAAARRRPPLAMRLFLFFSVLLFGVGIAWMAWAKLDEVTRADGQVIPSRHVQVVQNLEGGIVTEILVREGETVKKGQVLARMDPTSYGAEVSRLQARRLALLAAVHRLQSEAWNRDLEMPEEVLKLAASTAESERELFNSRRDELAASLDVLQRQLVQRRQDLLSLENEEKALARSLRFVGQELEMARDLSSRGLKSRIETLRLERQHSEITGQLETVRLNVPGARAAVEEAEERINERLEAFRAQALTELNERKLELASVEAELIASRDRMTRREVRAPMDGIVKRLDINTVGGVIQPGSELMEIVPLDDTLLIEARVRPSDIAFLHPGQRAVVKITAYDFTIYGGLDGRLEHISADTIVNEEGESFYLIRVRTDATHFQGREGELPIIPGMTAQVDLLTGEKTVLDYVMKPVLRARESALTER
ncbi:HlyD family type I secretion periplasmic adaptor subunit [Telmatospirillum sp. J64-1]|uniref:HlyD family type I secretion periplasmic adaptor subunit n=1 Tax=Telmatospirillum sp. J64-1 TaxID=2502183 RepID=UPI00115EFD00|nr:HlyD family type I secretion periplasmic adaptor subunit [Telmatospirillum sp. J64-1]